MIVPSVRFPVQYTNQQLGMSGFAQQEPTRNARYTIKYFKMSKTTHALGLHDCSSWRQRRRVLEIRGRRARWRTTLLEGSFAQHRRDSVLQWLRSQESAHICDETHAVTMHESKFWDEISRRRFVKEYGTVLVLSSRTRRILLLPVASDFLQEIL